MSGWDDRREMRESRGRTKRKLPFTQRVKQFLLGDYPQSAHSELNLAQVAMVVHCLLCFALAFVARSFYLQVINDEYNDKLNEQRTAIVRRQGIRGDILDRNSQTLAQNIKTYEVSVDPSQLKDEDVKVLLRELPKLFPKADMDKIKARITNKRRKGALLYRHASYEQLQKVKGLVKAFVSGKDTTLRIYPKGSLAGPLLGFVSIVKDHLSSSGRAGIENSYEWALSGQDILFESQKNGLGRVLPVIGAMNSQRADGRSIMTTIDMRLQGITEAYLSEQIEEMQAKQGVAVVMDPNNGDILAVAQVPTYDPNRYFEFPTSHHQNLFISSQFEPGSTMKPFLVAAALNERVVSRNEYFSGPEFLKGIPVGRSLITDSHPVEGVSTLEVIKYSSNVGAITISRKLGKQHFYSYLRKFGFGQPTQIGLYGELSGVVHDLNQWSGVNLATISYGYGVTVTPIQIAQAVSAIANGGELIAPRIALALTDSSGQIEEEFPVRKIRRVISRSVARQVTEGMMMVTAKGGTGTRASVDGYKVAGKTGTAHKAANGGYSEDVIASFMGFVPADKPRLAIYISIDTPIKEKYGGKVAAPVFARIVSEALPFLGVPPDDSVVATHRRRSRRSRRARGRAQEIKLKTRRDHTPWWTKDRFLTRASDDMVVPDVKGLSLPEALERLKPYQLQVQVEGSGVVVSQLPKSGELSPKHERIKLTLQRPMLMTSSPSGAQIITGEIDVSGSR